MLSEYVFVDSSMWKALVDPHDNFYQDAAKIWKTLAHENIRLLTTNYILDEAFTLIRKRCGLEAVNLLRNHLVSDWKGVKIIRVTIADEANAWNWFLKDWSELSFTDCVSFAILLRLQLKRVATFDKHFSRAGMEIERSKI